MASCASTIVRRPDYRPSLADAPDASRRFDRRPDGYLEVVFDPALGRH